MLIGALGGYLGKFRCGQNADGELVLQAGPDGRNLAPHRL